MHYGIKGMKWKKRKSQYADVDEMTKNGSPKDYMFEAGRAYHDQVEKKGATADKGKWMREYANTAHRHDQGYARQQAYKKNRKRVKKQQYKAKVKNTLNRIKKKVFVDTSGKQKVGNLYVSHETHLGR